MAGEKICFHHLLGLEKDEAEWKSPMEQKIPGISKFPEKRTIPGGCLKFAK